MSVEVHLPILLELAAVLGASLLGSVHCAGMCGPFAAFASGHDRGAASSGTRPPGAPSAGARFVRAIGVEAPYHLGRAATYVGLGVVAGAFGSAVDSVFRAAGYVHVVAILSGLLVVVWGLGAMVPRLAIPSPLRGTLGPVLVRLGKQPRRVRAGLLGALTPLLPCGWLYAFVVMAAGTGSALRGGLVMAVFWIGTVPALLGVGLLASRLGGLVRGRLPLVTGAALIALGLTGVLGRAQLPSVLSRDGAGASHPQAESVAPTHGGAVERPSCH